MDQLNKYRIGKEHLIQTAHRNKEVSLLASSLATAYEPFEFLIKLSMAIDLAFESFVPAEIMPFIKKINVAGFKGTLHSDKLKRQICLPKSCRSSFKATPNNEGYFSSEKELDEALLVISKFLRNINRQYYKSSFSWDFKIDLSLISRMQITILLDLGYQEVVIKKLFGMAMFPEEKVASKLTTTEVNDIYQAYEFELNKLLKQTPVPQYFHYEKV